MLGFFLFPNVFHLNLFYFIQGRFPPNIIHLNLFYFIQVLNKNVQRKCSTAPYRIP